MRSGSGPDTAAKQYPRVLLLTKTRITQHDNSGSSLGKWFSEWPRDRLAQLHSGGSLAAPTVCDHEFRLRGRERRFGRLFDRLKEPVLNSTLHAVSADRHAAGRDATVARVRSAIAASVIETGLWELVFSPRLSDAVVSWVRDFAPDVLYVQPSDLSYMRLGLLLHERFGTPICVAVPDDFPSFLYRTSPFGPVMHRVVQRRFKALIGSAREHLSNGPAMTQAYQRRYGVRFTPVMIGDDSSRFRTATPRRLEPPDVTAVVYSGSLLLGRWRSLLDLAGAADRLANAGIQVRVHAFVPAIPVEAKVALGRCERLVIHDAPSDRDVPALLRGGDILFLPESFEAEARAATRLSISTKSHLYMMSRRPALVYGPPGAGVVEYAREAQWGHVVDEEGVPPLEGALRSLIEREDLRKRLTETGWAVAAANHEAAVVREGLRQALVAAATGSQDHG